MLNRAALGNVRFALASSAVHGVFIEFGNYVLTERLYCFDGDIDGHGRRKHSEANLIRACVFVRFDRFRYFIGSTHHDQLGFDAGLNSFGGAMEFSLFNSLYTPHQAYESVDDQWSVEAQRLKNEIAWTIAGIVHDVVDLAHNPPLVFINHGPSDRE